MNMKKTIAAIAACAVATSAMATTVAAEGSITYNLVRNTYKTTPGTITHRAVISAVWDGEKYLNIFFDKADVEIMNGNVKWTVNAYGINGDGNKMDPLKFNNYVAKDATWNANASEWIAHDWYNNSVLSIPLDHTGLNIVNTNAKGIYVDLSITAEHNEDNNWNYGNFTDAGVSYLASDNNIAYLMGKKVVADTNNAESVVEVCATKTHVSDTVCDPACEDFALWKHTAAAAAAGNVVDATESNKTAAAKELHKRYPMMTNVNTTSNGNKAVEYFQGIAPYINQDNGDGTTYEVRGEVYSPAGCYNALGNVSNILAYLTTDSASLIEDGKSYINAVPVINDILANYDDVTFTFNTATEGVLLKHDNNENIHGYIYDGDGDKQYTKFAQHLYNFYGDEGTGYVYTDAYDWTGYTLFSGALVINGNLSMSLQDTNVFDFGASSLSFNWADAVDGATVNTYATYLTKMQLATSTMWFWDNLTISFANTEADDTFTQAGAEADEETVPDEEIEAEEEELGDEEIEDEEPADEVEPEEDEEPETTPEVTTPEVTTPVVTNPGTGNAPIALAVIPVALAAAAVVAKKRN